MGTITLTLAEWASNLKFNDLTPDAVDAAKRFLYDSIGCALGGYQQDDCRLMEAHLADMGGKGDCTFFGCGQKNNAVNAALYNSLAIRAMDFNDIYWKADPCHPSDIIPAATSIAEWKHLSGEELIVGIIIAYEMEMRLCEAGDPGIREKGWHHATLTAFASPMVAGRLLKLNPAQIQHAIGISASHSCTLGAVTAGKLTKMKNTVDPMATQAGVQAALLAEKGYSGPEHVIDGKEGLVKCMGPAWRLNMLTDGLGDRKKYKIVDCGMKAYPIEALTHSPLTALMQVLKEHKIKADDIKEVVVETIARAADILSDPAKYRPNSKETADHSMPYCLAVAIADGEVTPRQFKEARIRDPKLIPIMDSIRAVGNAEFEKLFPEKQPSRVTVRTKGGREFAARVDVPKGDYRDPMSMDEIKVKFDALAEPKFSKSQCGQIKDAIMRVDKMADVGELMKLTVAGK